MDGIADVLEQLDDGALLNVAGLDELVELSGQHGLLDVGAIGEYEAVAFLDALASTDLTNVKDLDERVEVDIATVKRKDGVRGEGGGHGKEE